MQHYPARRERQSFSDSFAMIVFTCVIACLTVASWARYLHHPDDRLFPLFWPFDRYNDLLNYSGKMLHLERGAAFVGSGYPVFNYLAPAAYLYHALLSASNPPVLFLSLVLGFFAALLIGSALLLLRQHQFRWPNALALLAILGSFPIAFVLYRANLEGTVWVVVTLSLILFLRGSYTASAVVLAAAISIKPFPVILLLLFLARRKYRAAGLCLVLTAALVLTALAALGPGVLVAYRGLQSGVVLYAHDYIQTFRSPNEQEYAHGILDVLKVLCVKYAWLVHHTAPEILTTHPSPTILPVLDAVFALLIAGIMVWKLRAMPVLNQVLGVCIGLTLLPPSAADYTLCSLYLPVLLLGYFLSTEVRSGRALWTRRHMLLLLLPLALLLSPLNLFGFWTSTARCAVLLVLVAGTLTLPLPLPALQREADPQFTAL